MKLILKNKINIKTDIVGDLFSGIILQKISVYVDDSNYEFHISFEPTTENFVNALRKLSSLVEKHYEDGDIPEMTITKELEQ